MYFYNFFILPIKRKIIFLTSLLFNQICGPFTTGLLVKCGNNKFAVDVRDMSVGLRLRYFGSYCDEELSRIYKLVNFQSSVIFIGAHIGALGIPTARRVNDAIFIEANPRTYELLMTNIAINDLKNIKSYNLAVGEKNGVINFVSNTVNSGGSKRQPLFKKQMYFYDKPNIITVPLVTLDSLLICNKNYYDLLYMDIEGSEFFALQGMSNILKNVKALIVEFIPHHLKYVAGVSVIDFLNLITPYFDYCYVPSKNKHLTKCQFQIFLESMYFANECDDGLVFTSKFINFNI